jgi:dienelactone hydrolase
MKPAFYRLCLAWLLAASAAHSATAPVANPGPVVRIFEDVPPTPDPQHRYVIYLHGRILESEGRDATSPDFGRYQYDEILEALATRGFDVISELRKGDAGTPFARHVADQVRRLLKAGVPASRIGIVGASKGGWLALAADAELDDSGISYVVLSGCGASTVALGPRLRGRVLSIHDEPDRFSPSCRATFAAAPSLAASREIVLHLGVDHGLVYRPLREWLDPATDWLLDR